jgi:hypothetical protein
MSKKTKEIIITLRTKDVEMITPIVLQILKDIKKGKQFHANEISNTQYWVSMRYLKKEKLIDKIINGKKCKTIKSKI